ncbi:hypothetical protein V6N13_089367 [Hibiscus sabdariffa]
MGRDPGERYGPWIQVFNRKSRNLASMRGIDMDGIGQSAAKGTCSSFVALEVDNVPENLNNNDETVAPSALVIVVSIVTTTVKAKTSEPLLDESSEQEG